MQRVAYNALIRAPFKVGAAVGGVLGFVGSVWPDKVRAMFNSGTFPVQTVSVVLLAAAVVYFALLWLLKPGEKDGEAGPSQTSHGPHSPNYGTVQGNVINQYGPIAPALQERKTDHWRGPRLQDRGSRPSTAERMLGMARPRRDQCPETPIWEALCIIADRIGDKDAGDGYPQARVQFRQAALEGRVEVWGQKDIPPAHMQDERRREVWSCVDPEHWEEYKLARAAGIEACQERPHTKEEEIGRHGGRYWNLKVHRDDIMRRWPMQRRTSEDGGDDGSDWKTV